MKSNTFRLVVLAIVLFASSTLFSFVVADRVATDIWQRLGLNRQEGTEKISQSFIQGYFHYAGVSNVKNLALNDRTAIARDLITFAKQYLSSPTFKAEYNKARTASRPVEPVGSTKTKEQIRDREIATLKKSIQDMEAVAKTLPADQQKSYQSSIDMFKKNLKDYQDPNNQLIEMMYQQEVGTHTRDKEQYDADLKKWEKEYPADCKQFVRNRLQHYLDVAGTVDFSAELVERGGKKRFVNMTFQGKNSEWKMIYRAGREVYEQTKAFIDQWMREL